MSADVLRQAAGLMRERAEAAQAGHEPMPPREAIDNTGTCDGCAISTRLVGSYDDAWLCADCDAAAVFEGSWHPAVALAVADWLEHTSRVAEAKQCEPGDMSSALAVARAYIGSDV